MLSIHVNVGRRACLAATLAVGLAIAVSAQTSGVPERFSAVAIDLDRGAATPVQIVVNRWSTDAERDRLMSVMMNKGADSLLEAFQDATPVGYLQVNNGLGWDLRFARRTVGEDSGERIILMTDRPLSFSEQANNSRSIDYPFTVIEMRLKNGDGEGTMSIATKIIPDPEGRLVTLENYDTQRIRLVQIKQERAAQ